MFVSISLFVTIMFCCFHVQCTYSKDAAIDIYSLRTSNEIYNPLQVYASPGKWVYIRNGKINLRMVNEFVFDILVTTTTN